jgi:CRISPR-associated exonuclease Cas4
MKDLAPISALNQLLYCPHRAFLMHRCMEMEANEHVWRGRALHRRVDRGESEHRGEIAIERSRWVSSSVLGIVGVIDQLERHPGGYRIVEFKRGQAPAEGVWPNDAIQIAAQALCLEEGGVSVSEGVVYYERSGARRSFPMTAELKEQARAACLRLIAILSGAERTSPVWGLKCRGCSMVDTCLPQGSDDAHLWTDAPSDLERP